MTGPPVMLSERTFPDMADLFWRLLRSHWGACWPAPLGKALSGVLKVAGGRRGQDADLAHQEFPGGRQRLAGECGGKHKAEIATGTAPALGGRPGVLLGKGAFVLTSRNSE